MSILRKTQQHCVKKAINVAVACIATSFSLPVFCIFYVNPGLEFGQLQSTYTQHNIKLNATID